MNKKRISAIILCLCMITLLPISSSAVSGNFMDNSIPWDNPVSQVLESSSSTFQDGAVEHIIDIEKQRIYFRVTINDTAISSDNNEIGLRFVVKTDSNRISYQITSSDNSFENADISIVKSFTDLSQSHVLIMTAALEMPKSVDYSIDVSCIFGNEIMPVATNVFAQFGKITTEKVTASNTEKTTKETTRKSTTEKGQTTAKNKNEANGKTTQQGSGGSTNKENIDNEENDERALPAGEVQSNGFRSSFSTSTIACTALAIVLSLLAIFTVAYALGKDRQMTAQENSMNEKKIDENKSIENESNEKADKE